MTNSTKRKIINYGWTIMWMTSFSLVGYLLAWLTNEIKSFDLASYWMGIVVGFIGGVYFSIALEDKDQINL